MQNLPTAEVYEKEFKYMPWGILIKEIETYILKTAPKNGRVLDLLCGPGYLLGKIKSQRTDLVCHGVDLDEEFISYAQQQHKDVSFEVADAGNWTSGEKFDVVLVTAGLHHLPFEMQEEFIKKVSSLLKKDGFAIIGDPYIDNYENEEGRKIAAAKLGYEYLAETIKNGGDEDMVDVAINIMINDIKLVEWKTAVTKNVPLFKEYFSQVEMHKTWPKEESEYGDYYFILKLDSTI